MSDKTKFDENAYEQALISLFRDELGYDYQCGFDVERDYRQPYYLDELASSLRNLNPLYPEEVIQEGVRQLMTVSDGKLETTNKRFMQWLQCGMEVSYQVEGETRTVLLDLVDYLVTDNNHFLVVNQWRVDDLASKRCDMVVMVNGLPLVVIELKSAIADNADIHSAYQQIRNYQQVLPSLFAYNAFNVISDMTETRAGTLTAKEPRYMEWKTEDGRYESTLVADYRTFFRGIFKKERLLNILQNFICFDENKGSIAKVLCAYHQYYAVNKAIARTYKAVAGSRKIGVFWHTQGSGKSFSMLFYAHQLIQKFPEVTIVVVTDRKDLDNQLYAQFGRCTEFLRQAPQQANSREELGKLLRNRKSGGIIFTTIQKFSEGNTQLSDRSNIVVMTDEAHRSQYGDEHWDSEAQKLKKGYSRLMREALPNASFIGFTGTPISDRDRDTEEVFGKYIDIYDMTQAVEDGATRPVYYESRVVNLSLDSEAMELLNEEFDHLSAEGATDEQIRVAKHDHSRLEVLLGEDSTIRSLVDDILKHYEENRQHELTGKAMIVALTRGIAIKIYRRILELRPDWEEKVKVVMSSSNQDPEDWQKIIGNDAYKQDLARRFKDDTDTMKIAIVRDMWLTGFDVPSLATMYVYKPMSGHNLMQAIARVNRVFPGKEGGLIVDYVGIAQALKSAMKQYSQRDRNRFGDPNIQKTALLKWKEEMEICRDLLHGFDYSDFFVDDNTLRATTITNGLNFLTSPKNVVKKKNFIDHSEQMSKATTLCRSLLSEHDKIEVCYMDALRVALVRLNQKGKISKHEINRRISELLTQSVKSEGIINLFGDRHLEFSIFDEAFMEEIKKMKERNLAVELLTKLLKDKVTESKHVNKVQSDKFSEMLNRCLSNYLKGLLTNEQVIEELLEMAKQIKLAKEAGNALGLNAEEMAFYDALSTPEGVKQAFSDKEFVELTKELTDTLRKNRTLDWTHKESARADMRRMVKRLLKKYKYPPEGAEKALESVMSQCELWADQEENLESEVPIIRMNLADEPSLQRMAADDTVL